jgi:undecaprenyl-diphosphatase
LDIIGIDYYLFDWINNKWSNPFFDFLLPLLRNKYFWAPLYVFLLAFISINIKKNAGIVVLFLFVTIGISDLTSSHLIKKTIKRERPCNNELINDNVRLLVRCGSGYSFTSSHATNHFAIAGFFFFLFGPLIGRYKWIFLAWAGSIAIAQVYVGVHYPLDILAGTILGLLVSLIITKIYTYIFGLLSYN